MDDTQKQTRALASWICNAIFGLFQQGYTDSAQAEIRFERENQLIGPMVAPYGITVWRVTSPDPMLDASLGTQGYYPLPTKHAETIIREVLATRNEMLEQLGIDELVPDDEPSSLSEDRPCEHPPERVHPVNDELAQCFDCGARFHRTNDEDEPHQEIH